MTKLEAHALALNVIDELMNFVPPELNQPLRKESMEHLRSNKEALTFEGVYITRGGFKVRALGNEIEILESPVEIVIGWKLPIDSQGKCSVSSDFDLIERDRTCERYMI